MAPPTPRLRTVRAVLLAGLSAVALAACATLPSPTPAREAKAASTYAAATALAAPAADWPADRWWTAYGDPQLDQLVQEALTGSPTLAAAEARLRKAESQTAQARAADAAEARLMLSTNIATAYADLSRLYAERDVAERAVALQQETSNLVRDRVANGLDTTGEQRQAEAQPLQSRAELRQIDEQIALTTGAWPSPGRRPLS